MCVLQFFIMHQTDLCNPAIPLMLEASAHVEQQHTRELIISLVLDQDNKLYLISLSILITCLLDDV